MKATAQKLFLQLFVLCCSTCVFAQAEWPSPEVKQMYHHAQEYMAAGNYKDAIITYKQAILLAPGAMVLYRDLGDALYRVGNYKEAEDVLAPLIVKPGADVVCYQLLAKSETAQQETKHALTTIKKGIEKFPKSGMLYHEKGNIYFAEKNKEDALNAWLDGIEKDPVFSKNYYDAANLYFSSERVVWGLIYGEQFLNIEHDTTEINKMKSIFFAAYKNMFDNIAKTNVTKYGDGAKHNAAANFEDAVLQVYTSLTPVISDGVTTENLTMVRVRFLMEWFSAYHKKYPFSLFSYQDKLLRNGRFDMYNEWLFGKAESVIQFDAWNKFHEGDMQRFLEWQSANIYTPVATDFYNERNMKGLFGKERKISDSYRLFILNATILK